jgi:glycosyltransferase involved in cell wall biosynthesis
MRLHLVSLPHTQTTGRFLTCAYTQKVVKFCRMMLDEYELILYSGDENEAPCAEHVVLFTEEERRADWGDGFDTVTSPLRWDSSESYWQRMNDRAVDAIRERAGDRDLLLLIGGWAQKPIADRVPLMAVEWAVGYEGIFSNFCAFESAAWMHHVYGRQQWATGRFYDAVIPNFFDPGDFHLGPKSDYLLFLGRLVERKGPHVAAQIADRVGLPLLVAGPGVAEHEPGWIRMNEGGTILGPVEYVGELDQERRAELLAGARALLAPTLYLEPFGGVTVEAMLSGTPAVTTDFGAFTETVTPEVGRRFRTLAQAADAVEQALELDPLGIRSAALDRFSLEAVRPRFDAWFRQLGGLWGVGWAA